MIVEEHKRIQLDLLKQFIEICERNNILYYVYAGTLLGGIRNQHYIPWDDDIDVMIFRKDYTRFLEASRKELVFPYYLQVEGEREDVYWGCMRIRNSVTTGATEYELANAPSDINMGMWIDVLVLDDTYSVKVLQKLHVKRIQFWQAMRLAKTYLRDDKRFWFGGKVRWYFAKKVASILTCSFIDNRICALKNKVKKGKYVASFSVKSELSTTKFLKRDWLENGKKIMFEELEVMAPENHVAVLTELYGSDYMTPPPEDKQNSGHFGLILDAKRPYTRYRQLLRPRQWEKGCENKTIVLFGSGQQANYFLEHEDKKYMPKYIVDNNKEKWGTTLVGIPIISPQELSAMEKDNLRVIIANIYWKEISEQLDELKIYDYYSYVNSDVWEKKKSK